MGRKKIVDETETVLSNIITAMQDKKAKNIISLDLNDIPESVTKYFVICHGTSRTQVDAIYDNVIEEVKKNFNISPFHKEGYENSEWILIDYFDIVVHIFSSDKRNFYKLEELWADAKLKEYESLD
jgi:ribosome-associated protein